MRECTFAIVTPAPTPRGVGREKLRDENSSPTPRCSATSTQHTDTYTAACERVNQMANHTVAWRTYVPHALCEKSVPYAKGSTRRLCVVRGGVTTTKI